MALKAPRKTTRSLVLWLRLAAMATAVAGVGIVCRLMKAQSAPVDFALAVAAALMFAQRFER